MSRYAMEWAKSQDPGDLAAKVVLLLLADRAEGSKHRVGVSFWSVADEASLTRGELGAAIERLAKQGLIEITSELQLRIPPKWRCLASAPPRKDANPEDRPTAVYRLYDEAGCLLYVGISDSPEARLGQHERDKYWWRQVATREVRWYYNRRAAQTEEDRIILAEDPKYNILDAARAAADHSVKERRRRYAIVTKRNEMFKATRDKVWRDIVGGDYARCPFPGVETLAARYGTDAITVRQVMDWLCRMEILSHSEGVGYQNEWGD